LIIPDHWSVSVGWSLLIKITVTDVFLVILIKIISLHLNSSFAVFAGFLLLLFQIDIEIDHTDSNNLGVLGVVAVNTSLKLDHNEKVKS
jgi:hypothetical protein